MDTNQFNKVFEHQIRKSEECLIVKAREYASGDDRLHNFKVSAGFTQTTPKEALWGFLTKHLVSLSDMVVSDEVYSQDTWDEKITDAINYLILLRALEVEEDELRTNSILDNQ